MSAQALAAEAEAPALYGVVAEFETPEQIIDAATAVRKAGYTAVEAYTPFAVEGLDTIVGHKPTRLGFVSLLAGMVGLVVCFGIQRYDKVVICQRITGGRPLNSWTNFIIITLEITVLFAALASVLYMIITNGMPRAYHPIFNTPGFENASRDRFFLCNEAADPKFDAVAAARLLAGHSPLRVSEVTR